MNMKKIFINHAENVRKITDYYNNNPYVKESNKTYWQILKFRFYHWLFFGRFVKRYIKQYNLNNKEIIIK